MDDSISVERLVKIAEELAEQGHFRAAVMEAMTALEERANEVVFQSLETRKGLPPNLVKWLKDKTKYSFDEKLHPIGEFALGKPISKGEKLWNDYKAARDLRNKVSHTAHRIKESEARLVIKTVKEWLYFLEGAQDVQATDATRDLTMELISLYAVLASHFRFPKEGRPSPIRQAVQNAHMRGQLSAESARVAMEAASFRNQVVHGVPVPPEKVADLVTELKRMLSGLKGIELDARPPEENG
jgi:hypothetical protein